MKKLFLAICLLFILVACNTVDVKRKVEINRSEKTVLLDNFPIGYEKIMKEKLESNGWKTYVVDNGKSTILIQCSRLTSNILLHGVEGHVRIIDLRTGKKLAQYDFTAATPQNIADKVVRTLENVVEY